MSMEIFNGVNIEGRVTSYHYLYHFHGRHRKAVPGAGCCQRATIKVGTLFRSAVAAVSKCFCRLPSRRTFPTVNKSHETGIYSHRRVRTNCGK
ncbi:UNVERIFIED_CONTAM: hypothetical protein PYX00_006883 [Menopon gallinae]|uniref:Uncharacterized protein n=1 Tax=Menopon gallinae TaxID=328185 RepID=A0AAW2HX38_9NEOP